MRSGMESKMGSEVYKVGQEEVGREVASQDEECRKEGDQKYVGYTCASHLEYR